MPADEINKNIEFLKNSLCERKDLYCVMHFTNAIFSINGLSDGWSGCLENLKTMRAMCRNKLTPEENDSVSFLINSLHKMLGKNAEENQYKPKFDADLFDKLEEIIKRSFD